uniref:ACB domain-containing protein n=1 Tax=Trichuris muris TaxID=70415 RepID=A0A5S6QJ21_TRIMR
MGSAVEEAFEKSAADVRNLKSRPTDSELLEVYGLYKQATVGDNNEDAPRFLEFKAKSKWSAWKSYEGISKEEAMQKYTEKVQELVKKYGLT